MNPAGSATRPDPNRPATYVRTSLSQISLGRKMSERRHSLFLKPWQHMVVLRFLRQNTVARVIRLSGSSPPAGAAMAASAAPAHIHTGQSRDPGGGGAEPG